MSTQAVIDTLSFDSSCEYSAYRIALHGILGRMGCLPNFSQGTSIYDRPATCWRWSSVSKQPTRNIVYKLRRRVDRLDCLQHIMRWCVELSHFRNQSSGLKWWYTMYLGTRRYTDKDNHVSFHIKISTFQAGSYHM